MTLFALFQQIDFWLIFIAKAFIVECAIGDNLLSLRNVIKNKNANCDCVLVLIAQKSMNIDGLADIAAHNPRTARTN